LRFRLAQVLRDSYFWASQVKAAAVTTTARGVTSKMLLLGTAADQVCRRDGRSGVAAHVHAHLQTLLQALSCMCMG
jgi:ER membrane protein complex subunit 1, C-terminal